MYNITIVYYEIYINISYTIIYIINKYHIIYDILHSIIQYIKYNVIFYKYILIYLYIT